MTNNGDVKSFLNDLIDEAGQALFIANKRGKTA
jgi:hypothetical protein